MADLLVTVPGARTIARRKRPLRERAVPATMLAPTIVAAGVVIGFPIVVVLVESLFDVNPSHHQGWRFIGLGNYARILRDQDLGGVLVNSVVWTFGSVVLQFAIALAAALLVRSALRGRAWAWLRALYVLPWATPMIVGALSWKWLYQPQYGLIDTTLRAVGLNSIALPWLSSPATALPAVLLTNVWRGFPFIMVMLLSGMASISDEIYEASDVDGATFAQRTRLITLPLLRPTILLSTLMSLIWTFNNFSLIYVMTGGGPAGSSDILTTYVYKSAFQQFDFGYAAALSVFLFVVVGIGSLIYVRMLGKDALK